jgi:Undecaprenyl-phosphate glucose phosphotransferase
MTSVAELQTEQLADPARPATAEEPSGAERRGPFRPDRLAPTRARLHGRLVARLFQAGDALTLALAALSLGLFTEAGRGAPLVYVASILAVLAALGVAKAYDFGRRESALAHAGRVLAACFAGLAGGVLIIWPSTATAALGAAIAPWLGVAVTVVALAHVVWWSLVRAWRANGRLVPNLVIVGATDSATHFIESALASREVNVLGVFDDRLGRAPGDVLGVPVLGDTRALVDHRIMPFVDRVVITVPSRARPRVAELIERLRILPNEITLLLDGEAPSDEAAAISRVADVPLAHISGPPIDHLRAFVKRAQDIVFGTLGLALAAPVMLCIAIAVRLDSPGPILFRQTRHGFNNEEIVVWKFRSMRVAAQDLKATRQVTADDDRVTRVGRFIRRTSLDELPQIINVLKGEMSLVGPRPHAIGMRTGDVESARLVAEYAHRHRMKPGITGWAAIHGSRGPVDTPESVRQRVALDVEYIERQSFWLDLYIMLMTLPCLLGDSKAVR